MKPDDGKFRRGIIGAIVSAQHASQAGNGDDMSMIVFHHVLQKGLDDLRKINE